MSARGSQPEALPVPVSALAASLVQEAPQPDAPLANDRAFRRFVEENADFVWRTLRRLGVPERSADDATQSVLIAASRRRADIEAGRERAFLFGIVSNVAAHARRACAREGLREGPAPGDRAPEVTDSGPSAEDVLHERRSRALLDQVLAEMPDELREVFVLFELEELTMAQIADMASLPPGTVASRLRRAREVFHKSASRLRARLAGGER
jgi:RNA polymerase sigma-70 factor (ECF subfamily)